MNMENRNYFSLHCVQMETQLIHANMNSLYLSLNAMASEEATSHSEVGNHFRNYIPHTYWINLFFNLFHVFFPVVLFGCVELPKYST